MLNLASNGGKSPPDLKTTSILKTVVSFANTLGISTIIDGIESDSQLYLAREIGGDEMQGLYFGAPVKLTDHFQPYTSAEPHSVSDAATFTKNFH